MSLEGKTERCGLSSESISFSYTGRHHFGPEKFLVTGINIACKSYNCPLSQIILLKPTHFVGASLEDISKMIVDEANTPESDLDDQIVRLRLSCPFYIKNFSK